MTQIKGAAIRGTLKFVKQSGFAGGIPAIIAKLPPDVRPIYDTKILSADWYPYAAYSSLLSVVDREVGRGDLSLMPQLGHFAVRQDVSSVLKIVSIFASVEKLLSRGTFFWSRTCDRGRVEVVEPGGHQTVIALQDFPDVAATHCHVLIGWLEGLALAVGAKSARVVKSRCVHRGDDRCEYRGDWA